MPKFGLKPEEIEPIIRDLMAISKYVEVRSKVDTHGLTPVALEMQNQKKPLPAFEGFHPQANAWGPQPGI